MTARATELVVAVRRDQSSDEAGGGDPGVGPRSQAHAQADEHGPQHERSRPAIPPGLLVARRFGHSRCLSLARRAHYDARRMTSSNRLYLFDTTLRDGAQTQGVDFTVADKAAIARLPSRCRAPILSSA